MPNTITASPMHKGHSNFVVPIILFFTVVVAIGGVVNYVRMTQNNSKKQQNASVFSNILTNAKSNTYTIVKPKGAIPSGGNFKNDNITFISTDLEGQETILYYTGIVKTILGRAMTLGNKYSNDTVKIDLPISTIVVIQSIEKTDTKEIPAVAFQNQGIAEIRVGDIVSYNPGIADGGTPFIIINR